jgi:hypothetical protein
MVVKALRVRGGCENLFGQGEVVKIKDKLHLNIENECIHFALYSICIIFATNNYFGK